LYPGVLYPRLLYDPGETPRWVLYPEDCDGGLGLEYVVDGACARGVTMAGFICSGGFPVLLPLMT
jgi:hypothetical protein